MGGKRRGAGTTVYLVHLDEPYRHAQHLLGLCGNLEKWLARQRRAKVSPLLRAASRSGIAWEVVRTWAGGPDLLRRLQAQSRGRLCPRCHAAYLQRQYAARRERARRKRARREPQPHRREVG